MNSKQPIRLGISPCPNDTFIFEGWLNGHIPDALPVQVTFADVQTLNEMAMANELDAVKVSCGVLPHIQSQYAVLRAGGAMGFGCGPLLLNSQGKSYDPQELTWLPGQNTTASFLFHHWYAIHFGSHNKARVHHVPFDQVYQALLQGKAMQGVVIHEHRFTWERDHLKCHLDLGAHWEQVTKSPIPLGVIAVRHSLGSEIHKQVTHNIRQSLQWAYSRNQIVTPWIRSHAQELEEQVMIQHIRTFVTSFSMEIQKNGERAIQEMLKLADMDQYGKPMGSMRLIFAGDILPSRQDLPVTTL